MFISQKSIQKIHFLSTDIWPLEQWDVSFDLLGPAISKGTNDSRGFVRQLERAHIFISVLLYTEASQLYRCCRTRVGLCCCFCVWSEGVKVCIIGGHCQNEQWRGQTKGTVTDWEKREIDDGTRTKPRRVNLPRNIPPRGGRGLRELDHTCFYDNSLLTTLNCVGLYKRRVTNSHTWHTNKGGCDWFSRFERWGRGRWREGFSGFI